jgi:uncharacterized protein
MTASVWLLLATGLVVGFASGAMGIGGAILLIPILVFVFGFSQARAQGTSIGALVPPIGVFAAIHYYREGLLDLRAAALIAFGFVFGALAGAVIVPYLPQIWLKRAFASLLVYVAVQMAFSDPSRRVGAVLPGVLASGALWLVYLARRLVGARVAPPPAAERPPPDYYI